MDWRLRIPSARTESQSKTQPYTFWRLWIFSCCQAGRAQFTLSQMLWTCQHYAKLWLFGSGSAKHHWLNSGQTDVHVTAWEVYLEHVNVFFCAACFLEKAISPLGCSCFSFNCITWPSDYRYLRFWEASAPWPWMAASATSFFIRQFSMTRFFNFFLSKEHPRS